MVLSLGISHFYSPFTLSRKGIALVSDIDNYQGQLSVKVTLLLVLKILISSPAHDVY